MDILLKITPFASNQCIIESHFFKIPVIFAYEDKNSNFTYNITEGLPIIGKPHPELKTVSYFIGETCSLENFTSFVRSLNKGLPSSITFNETDDNINIIEYNPALEEWKHKIGYKDSNFGSTLTIKLNKETLNQFIYVLEGFRRFAFVNIEGHKKLLDSE